MIKHNYNLNKYHKSRKTSDLMIKHIKNSKVEGTTFIYVYI